MFRITSIVIAATCVAVAVPVASAKPIPDGPGIVAAAPAATGTVKVVVNGNNTIAYLPNGCRINGVPGQRYFDSHGNTCPTIRATFHPTHTTRR